MKTAETTCLLALAMSLGCVPAGDVDVERRHYDRPDDDGPIRVEVDATRVEFHPVFHPRNELDAPFATSWFADVDVSESVHAVHGHPTRVREDGFELVLAEGDLRAALRGAPLGLELVLETGARIELSIEVRASLLFRRSSGPYSLDATLQPSSGWSPFFETSLAGPDIANLEVAAAAPPTVFDGDGEWRFGWKFEDLLTSAEWRNGAVDLDVTDALGESFDLGATLAPAVHRVDVLAVD